MTFKEKCKKAGINYNTAKSYRRRHIGYTDDQVIQHCLLPKGISFAEKCRKVGIIYDTACSYKRCHPELTDNEIIVHYRRDLRLNIFGNIILDDKSILE